MLLTCSTGLNADLAAVGPDVADTVYGPRPAGPGGQWPWSRSRVAPAALPPPSQPWRHARASCEPLKSRALTGSPLPYLAHLIWSATNQSRRGNRNLMRTVSVGAYFYTRASAKHVTAPAPCDAATHPIQSLVRTARR